MSTLEQAFQLLAGNGKSPESTGVKNVIQGALTPYLGEAASELLAREAQKPILGLTRQAAGVGQKLVRHILHALTFPVRYPLDKLQNRLNRKQSVSTDATENPKALSIQDRLDAMDKRVNALEEKLEAGQPLKKPPVAGRPKSSSLSV